MFILGFAKKILLANPMGQVADAVFGAASAVASGCVDWRDRICISDLLRLLRAIRTWRSGWDACSGSSSRRTSGRRTSRRASPIFGGAGTFLFHWLRDYLYLPLGGNRLGPRRTYINLALVMLLGGLWHGAAWQFLAWGGYHGSLLAFERWIGKKSPYEWLPARAASQ